MPWRAAARTLGDEIPGRCDVVVVGGSLAGLAIAAFLAEGGARPVLLEASDAVGGGASGRAPGLLLLGLAEHPWRLRTGLGPGAADLYRFAREDLALASELFPIEPSGGVWAAVDAAEAEQIPRSVDALREMGVPVEAWEAERVAQALGCGGFGPGMFCPDEGTFDPAVATRCLLDRALAAGARVAVRRPVRAVDDVADGLRVRVDGGSIACEVVLYAGGAGLVDVDPYFEERLYPFREQVLATAPVQRRFEHAWRAQLGYARWLQTGAGEIVLSGCRWATPHMEECETELAVVDAIQRKLDAFLRERLLVDAPVTHRWSWIDAKSCDGLPIVGPIPGSIRRIVCAGFHGNQAGLGLRAARAVADGLLTGRAEGVPYALRPERFV